LLSPAFREVRTTRARRPVVRPEPISSPRDDVRMSRTATCIDVLKGAGRPLHVSALLRALDERDMRTTRESLVSAITKKLVPVGPFVRTAPNTFGLAGRDDVEV
jgi:hypothetical protein